MDNNIFTFKKFKTKMIEVDDLTGNLKKGQQIIHEQNIKNSTTTAEFRNKLMRLTINEKKWHKKTKSQKKK